MYDYTLEVIEGSKYKHLKSLALPSDRLQFQHLKLQLEAVVLVLLWKSAARTMAPQTRPCSRWRAGAVELTEASEKSRDYFHKLQSETGMFEEPTGCGYFLFKGTKLYYRNKYSAILLETVYFYTPYTCLKRHPFTLTR